MRFMKPRNELFLAAALAALPLGAMPALAADFEAGLLPDSTGIAIAAGGKTEEFHGELVSLLANGTTTPATFSVAERHENPKNNNIELRLTSSATSVTVSAVFSSTPEQRVCHLGTTIENPAGERIDSIRLLDIPLSAPVQSFDGLGQPVYYTDWLFFGQEYPAGVCTVDQGHLRIERFYGTTATKVLCEPVVVGAKRDGMNLADSFVDYVLEAKQHPLRTFTIYNSWYDLRTFNEKQLADAWNAWQTRFLAPYKVKLDSFVLDDGWDKYDSLWDVSQDRFPQGFTKIRKQIEGDGSRLGIWVSPWGGYGKTAAQRRNYGAAHGYEMLANDKQQGFCLAGPKYKARFIELCTTFMDRDGVNYFKFDGFPSRCSDVSHGHPVGDKFEQAAFVDAFLDSLKQLKGRNQDLFLNLTTGVWLSPWWLLHGDAVWRGEMDYNFAGTGEKPQQSETYVDCVLQRAFREKKYQFPISYLMTHGIIKGHEKTIGETTEPIRMWEDRVALYLARGMRMQELYISADLIKQEEWAFLAKMLKWTREREAVLERTHMILGDPQKGEPYGYTHWKGDQVIFVLRNPSQAEQTIKLDWASLAMPDNVAAPKRWRIVYASSIQPEIKLPETMELRLPPQEVLVVEGGVFNKPVKK